ncbi:MAG TPA: amidase [Alphaproteobacteria bacterium]|nr:amidase [Alphaproteobacteria bacterium]
MQTIRELSRQLATGQTSARALSEAALARIEDPAGEGSRAFTKVYRDAALAEAEASDRLRTAGIVPSPLAGIPVSIKDLCDVAGETTLAGSTVRRGAPPAERDAPVLARLRAAGAVIVGRTNMTEFAMGTLGLNPHYGDAANPWDRATRRIPGGSSSGAAVSVSDGMAVAALGTDTAGSVRVPAGLCGLAGFKPTARRVPTEGLFPLSHTLDSAGPLAPSVDCCAIVDAVFAGEAPWQPKPFPLRGLRIGVLKTLVQDGMDDAVSTAFEAALRTLAAAGALVQEMEIPSVARLPELNSRGGFSAAEAYWLHCETLATKREQYDPHVASRILRGAEVSAADYLDLQQARRELRAEADAITPAWDIVALPTTPIVAPPIAGLEVAENWSRTAGLLLRNSLVANFLDRCALTVPCHVPGEAPVGLMLMGETMADRRVLEIGVAVEAALAARHG